MKRLIAFIVIAVAVVFAASLSRPANAVPSWPPLLNCSDVDGNGVVNIGDVVRVIGKFNTIYPNDNYQLLYDVAGGGNINIGDVVTTIADFNRLCPLVEKQVARATVATMKYQDCQDALDDGYVQSTQFVPQMGIHLAKNQNLIDYPEFYNENGNDQLTHPIGLICTDSNPGGPDVADRLIGMWYVMPNPEACAYYGIDPATCSNDQPEGFDTAEDNDHPQEWHDHEWLCIWNLGTTNASSGEGISQPACEDTLQGVWFSKYAWMVHLYNFIPNENGRFMMWSSNVPPE